MQEWVVAGESPPRGGLFWKQSDPRSLSSGVHFQSGNASPCFPREGETEDCEPQQVVAGLTHSLLSNSGTLTLDWRLKKSVLERTDCFPDGRTGTFIADFSHPPACGFFVCVHAVRICECMCVYMRARACVPAHVQKPEEDTEFCALSFSMCSSFILLLRRKNL